ncbi:hypothetical protein CBW65_22355 [Tumebacillus avium]|uniref:Uncharacterized protein n=1 Tax=Tumebacillus avium TaxID=1903704 RepID=A0A1Y0ITZ0_9BACL|nr:DNRLRE domain-containing protein [Tumebacillus avium]ARU63429.1 hypothetical protein CBW65_22355 [Tumebacillus avium]
MNLIYKLRMIRFVLIPLLSLALLLAPIAPYSVLSLFTGLHSAEAAMPKETPKKKFPDRPAKGQKVEIPEWRSANSKHFLKDDGYFEVEVSKNSMFYQDKGTRKWMDIDNSLVASNKKGFGYKNKANRFDAQFAGGANTGSIMQLNLENASMDLLPLGIGNGAGAVKNNKITYANAFKNTDLEYTVESDSVKEEIVLKKADASAVYLFELKLNNLKYIAKEDGSIEFQYADTSKFAFDFPKPFMFEGGDLPQSDDVKEHSDKVTQTIREEGGKLLLELKADQAWLQAPEREFPVVIDPTADMTMVDETRISDTFASRTNPTTAYNTASHMYVGNSTSYGESQSYILFPLPGLPDGSRVTDAKMKLYNYLTKTTTTNVDVYEVTSGWWPASAITWNTRPTVGQKVTTKGVAAAGWTEFNITTAAKKWYEGKLDNWGLQLTAGTAEDIGFTANDNTSAAYRPVLTLEYWVDPEGTNHFWEYTSDGVMPFKGNLTLSATDLTTPGRGVDVSVNRNYNSRQTTKSGVFGPNWLSILDMRVWELFGSVAYLDGTGTRHVFNRSHYPQDAYTPPPGVTLSLKRGTEFWEITEPDNTVYYFDRTHSLLRKVTDSNNQTTSYTYDTNDRNWKTITIKDPSGRVTTVTRQNGKIVSAVDAKGRAVTYTYDVEQGTLKSVTLTEGAESISTQYTYKASQAAPGNYLLTSVIDAKGHKVSYEHDIYDRVERVIRTFNGVDVVKTYTYNTENAQREVTVQSELCGAEKAPYECERVVYKTNDNGNIVMKDVLLNVVNGVEETATTVYTWAPNNWIVDVRVPNHKKSGETYKHTTQIEYAENGEPQKVTTPDGKSMLLNYDTSNNLIAVKDAMSNVKGTSYDSRNNPVDITDGVGNTIMLDYDSYGNLIGQTDPMNLAENYVYNSGFEEAVNGSPTGWSAVTGTGSLFVTDSSTRVGGYNSLHIKSATTSGLAGKMKYTVPVTQKLSYNLSAGIKAGANSSAEMRVTFRSASGTELSTVTGLINTKAGAVSGDWMNKSTLIEAPIGAAKAELEVAVNGVGEAWFDNLIFEGGTGRTGNMVNVNYGFEHDLDQTKLADGWVPYVEKPTDVMIYYNDKNSGVASERINGDPAVDKHVEQTIEYTGTQGMKFSLSGFGKQVGASSTGVWDMRLVFYKQDGTTQEVPISFNKTTAGWQQASKVIEAPVDFKYIGIKLSYNKMPSGSYALFDDVKLNMLNTTSSTISKYNYIGNTSFEFDYDTAGAEEKWPDGWNIVSGTKGDSVKWVGLADGQVYTGEKALQINAQSTTDVEINRKGETYPFNGKPYTIVGYVKTSNLTANATIYVDGFEKTGTVLGSEEITIPKGSKDWTRVSLVVDPVGYFSMFEPAVKFRLGIKVAKGGAGTVYLDNIRVQEGNFKTVFRYATGGNHAYNLDDPLGNTTWFDADPLTGYVKSIKNPIEQEFFYDYNLAGRLTSYTYPFQGAVGATATNKTVEYKYDLGGKMTSVVDPNGKSTIGFRYNDFNQIEELTETSTLSGQPAEKSWSYLYDGLGRISTSRSPSGRFTGYVYDNAGRVTRLTFGNFSQSAMPFHIDFAYDYNGNLIQYDDTTISYDNMNRPLKVTEADKTRTVSYAYNDAGLTTKSTVQIMKDPSYPIQWESEYIYDSVGQPKGFKDSGRESWYLYNESGQQVKVYNSNGTSSYYARDEADNMKSVLIERDGLPIYEARYEYDDNSSIIKMNTVSDGSARSVQYEYDTSGQLLKETYSDSGSLEYRYDALGNRVQVVQKNGDVVDYTYNTESNRLLSVGSNQYQYDLDGNVTSDGVRSYEWGTLNKMSSATTKDGKKLSIGYDVLGKRSFVTTLDGGSKEFHYDGGLVSYVEYRNSADALTSTVRFAYDHSGKPVFMTFNGKQYWYHFDKIGSVIFLTDEAGQKVAAYEYDAFGNTKTVLDTAQIAALNPYRFNGYWYDEDFEKYYLEARYYDPAIGRFLSKDPVAVHVSEPVGLNSYAYAGNDPVQFSDPTGTTIFHQDMQQFSNDYDPFNGTVKNTRNPDGPTSGPYHGTDSGGGKKSSGTGSGSSSNKSSGGGTSEGSSIAKYVNSIETGLVGGQADDAAKAIKHKARWYGDFTLSGWKTSYTKLAVKTLGRIGGIGFGIGVLGDLGLYSAGLDPGYNFIDSLVDNGVQTALGIGVGFFLGSIGAPLLLVGGVVLGIGVGYTALSEYKDGKYTASKLLRRTGLY